MISLRVLTCTRGGYHSKKKVKSFAEEQEKDIQVPARFLSPSFCISRMMDGHFFWGSKFRTASEMKQARKWVTGKDTSATKDGQDKQEHCLG
jgi:hypothetical protein